MSPVYVITGIPASGKSTVGQALAEHFEHSVHLHGDVFRRWIVNGREDMTPHAGPEAHRQLSLRHRLAADAAMTYQRAGFTVVLQDVILGAHLTALVEALRTDPVHVVVLAPSRAAVLDRAGQRQKGSGHWSVEALDTVLRRDTPRLGLRLDTSALSVAETVDAILAAFPVP